MFRRLEKFDGPIFGGRDYIRDVSWVTYLGGVYSGEGAYIWGGVLTGVIVFEKTIFR